MTSKELFVNMTSIPDKDSTEYDAFFQHELEKIKYGVTINGVYIHGWLYWHLNHWRFFIDDEDKHDGRTDIVRVFRNPDLRDNEWLVAEYLKKAEDEKKGLLLFGTRRFAKTEIESSWIGRGATIYNGSQNVVSSTNDNDIKILAASIDKGLSNLHPYFKFDRLLDDWRKEVALGIKEKKVGGKRIEWSKILIRNLDEGRNTEAIAGTTPKTLVIDEIGKCEKVLESFQAAVPGFTSPYGWRCVPLLTGTGGNFIPNSDAEKMFNEPEAFNFLAVEWPGKAKKYGVFLPGTYRMEAKVETTFGTFIKDKSGILLPEDSELYNFPMKVSDEEKAKLIIKGEIETAEKSIDVKASLKARMYFPIEPEDCFLSDEENDFPIEAIREHLAQLDAQEKVGEYVELVRDATGKVSYTFNTKLKPITDFPVTSATIKDAPVVIYEPPVSDAPFGLYIAGGDPINQGMSNTSSSLGTVYIYKRLYDPLNGTFQNMIVASYAGRPSSLKKWHEIVEMLLELYNATIMIENVGTNFIEYIDGKNKGHLLADGYNLLREIQPNTSILGKPKGLPPTVRVIAHCMGLLYDYCKEELMGEDEHGKPIKKLGVTRIKDRMLLIEMLNFNSVDNFDRIVAFRHAIAYDTHLQKNMRVIKYSDNQVVDTTPEKRRPRSPFTLPATGTFTKINNPFSIK